MRMWKSREKPVQDPFAGIRGLADGMDSALFLCNRQGLILFANEPAKVLFNFPQMEGRTILAVTLSHTIDKIVRAALDTGELQSDEISLRIQDDRMVVIRAWPNLGTKNQVYLSLLDVTTLRHLERVRRDFVANVSHELRTPLTTIRAMAEILADDDPDSEELRDRYHRQILGEVDRLTLIVEDLLTLSVAEGRALRKEPCDLDEVVEGIVLQLQPKADQKQLSLTYHGSGQLEIEANPTQLAQVILNLIDNALNYTVEGSVQVRLSRQGEEVLFEVEDTGLGIPSEDLPRIFERFYRVDKSRSRASGGTGLGLSIVKHMVESHGGRVSVESALNRGSTFRCVLPIGSPYGEG